MRGLVRHLAVCVAVLASAAAPAHAADFLKAIDDVPLVGGLVEQPEPVVFETDQGRVVRTGAEGQVGAAEIEAFYVQSLPALGWKRIGEGLVFARESERLTITVRAPASSRPVKVTFELVVRLASTKLPE